MDELDKIRTIKRSKHSRAYVTGLHSAPAGIEAANLLLRHSKKNNHPVFFALIVFPDLDRLLSLGNFSALKDAWRIMAKRLRKHLPTNSLVAQTQFGLFMQVWDSKAAQKLSERNLETLVRELNEPFSLSSSSNVRSFSLRSYAGYQLTPTAGEVSKDAECLLSKLAIAATSAKQSDVLFKRFSPSLHKLLTRREHAIRSLPEAIEQGHLDIHFQPVFAVRSKSIYGAQTKVSWQDSQHGTINQAEVKQAIRLTGTAPTIAKFSIKKSLCFLKDIKNTDYFPQGFKFFIAIPFDIFLYPHFDLYRELQKLLAHAKVQPKHLCIEFEGNPELNATKYLQTLRCFKQLNSLNINICLSSDNNLTTLKLLSSGAVHYLKHNLNNTLDISLEEQVKILGSTQAAARYNRTAVIIENVNLQHQLKLLNPKKVSIVQGSLYSEPLSQSLFKNYLKYSATPVLVNSTKKTTPATK